MTANTIKEKIQLSPFRKGTLEINQSTGKAYFKFRYKNKILYLSGIKQNGTFIPDKENELYTEWLSKPRRKRINYLFKCCKVNTMMPDIQHSVQIYQNTGSARMNLGFMKKRYDISGVVKNGVFRPLTNTKIYLQWLHSKKEKNDDRYSS